MLPLQLFIPRVFDLGPGRLRLVIFLIDLGQGFGRLRILQFQVPGREEGVRLVCAYTNGRIKVVVNDSLFDQIFERLDRLLGDGRHDLSGVLKVEILLEKRVFRPRA